jgi:Mn-dependent DtxR family transcriptional regulator
MIDTIWYTMQEDEFYSPSDLANILRQPPYVVVRVLEFLEKYGFAERVTKRELIFRRLENKLGPRDALKALRMLLGEADNAGRIANVSEAPRRFRPVR